MKREKSLNKGQEAKQFEIARNLKLRNFSTKDIADITKLTEEQVVNL